MNRFLRKSYNVFSYLFFDPLGKIRQYRALPVFLKNLRQFRSAPGSQLLPMRWADLYVTTADRYRQAGVARGHYFFQDLWAATKIYRKNIKRHTDIGSRIDGFIAHLLPFCRVDYVDLRKLESNVDNLHFIQGSILSLPFPDNSIESLSCLHVIEHIGLGRYGDPIDPAGHEKAALELARVLKPGGTLYLGTPVGQERVCFDAHRVFHPATVGKMFDGLELKELSLIDDKGERIIQNAATEQAAACRYGCGLFEFVKPTNRSNRA